MSTEQPPEVTEAAQDPSIGVDEWVARSGGRREYRPGRIGDVQRLSERVGWWPKLALAAVFGAIVPLLTVNDFQLQVGINGLLLRAAGRSASTCRSAGPACSTSATSRSSAFGAYGFALLLLAPARCRWACASSSTRSRRPDRDGRGGGRSGSRRAAVAAIDRRLPGDRDAVLRRGVRRVHQQRRPDQARRPQRNLGLDRPLPRVSDTRFSPTRATSTCCWCSSC